MTTQGRQDPEALQGEDSLRNLRERRPTLGRIQGISKAKVNDSLRIKCRRANGLRR